MPFLTSRQRLIDLQRYPLEYVLRASVERVHQRRDGKQLGAVQVPRPSPDPAGPCCSAAAEHSIASSSSVFLRVSGHTEQLAFLLQILGERVLLIKIDQIKDPRDGESHGAHCGKEPIRREPSHGNVQV